MKVSVVIPVYNAEKYLQRCISSVLNQTYPNWEMILVDDGSIDHSLKICQASASSDERIKIIHQSNKGPGEARNVGIAATSGDYIVFIDADDYVDKDYFELLSRKTNGNDVIFIDVQQRLVGGKDGKNEYMSSFKYKTLDDILRSCMTGYFPWGGVRKVVSSSLLKENGIEFSNARIGEEAVFTYRVLSSAKSFAFIDEKPVYYYELHDDSQSNILMDDPWGKTYALMRDCLKQEDKYDLYADTLNSLNVMATLVSVNNLSRKNSFFNSIKLSKKRVRDYKKSLDARFTIDTKHLPSKAKVMIPFLRLSFVLPIVLASKLLSFIRG